MGLPSGGIEVSGFVVVLLAHGWLAVRVSYQRRDAVFLLVPVWGLVWSLRIIWRIAFPPFRDWAPRPDEAGGWFYLAGLSEHSEPIFVVPDGQTGHRSVPAPGDLTQPGTAGPEGRCRMVRLDAAGPYTGMRRLANRLWTAVGGKNVPSRR